MSNKSMRMPLPHEHGAWAMFIVPLVIGTGVGVARATSNSDAKLITEMFLFAIVSFGFFLLRYPLMMLFKARNAEARQSAILWSAVYGALTSIGGLALVVVTQLGWLVLVGLLGVGWLSIYLWLVARRQEMSVVGEWLGIAGLALAAPGAYLVAARALDTTAIALYFLCVLFFGGTVYYIKFKVREQPRVVKPDASVSTRLFAARAPMFYSIVALAFVAGLVFVDWIPAFVIVAFGLPLFKTIIGALDRPARLNVPRLGITELGYSIAFAIIVLLAFR